jgi:hypothetical protein
MSIEIRGADQLAKLARDLKDAGRKDLQRELSQAINRAVKPVKQQISHEASAVLPRRGGLAREASGARLATRRRATAKVAGVRLAVSKSPVSLWHLNQGIIRHRRDGKLIESQHTAPGFWDRPTEAAAGEVRRQLMVALDEISRKLDR